MPFRAIAVAGILGAVAMLISSLTPYQLMAVIAELIEPDNEEYLPTGGWFWTALIRMAGACALSISIVAAARQSIKLTPQSRMLLRIAAISFVAAILFVTWGNTVVAVTMHDLASATQVRRDPLLAILSWSVLPTVMGHALLFAGTGALMWAVCTSKNQPCHEKSMARRSAIAVAAVSGGVFCLSSLWMAVCVHSFELQIMNLPTTAENIAGSVMGSVLSVYVSLFGITGFALAVSICACAKSAAAVSERKAVP